MFLCSRSTVRVGSFQYTPPQELNVRALLKSIALLDTLIVGHGQDLLEPLV